MLKFLKKYSKLLALALIFSSSLPFLASATEPQDTNDFNIIQSRKRKREEKVSEILSHKYTIDGMIPDFVAEGDDKNKWPKCEMPVYFRLGDDKLFESSHPTAKPCNHSVKNFFLIPDRDKNMHIIGYECIKHFQISQPLDLDKNLPKKLQIRNPLEAQKFEKQKDIFIATKILKYFYDQRNWNNRCKHKTINDKDVASANSNGNFVLDLGNLKIELEKEGYTVCSSILTLQRCGKYNFKLRCNGIPPFEIKSSSSFENDIPLSDDKIFSAFDCFCAFHRIYQPFSLKKN